jgi:hypothetical protein
LATPPKSTEAMTEIEKIFSRCAKITVTKNVLGETSSDRRFVVPLTMNSEQFTQALAEVFELVKVTDEEINYNEQFNYSAISRFAAKWSRDLQQNKLEKLLNP